MTDKIKKALRSIPRREIADTILSVLILSATAVTLGAVFSHTVIPWSPGWIPAVWMTWIVKILIMTGVSLLVFALEIAYIPCCELLKRAWLAFTDTDLWYWTLSVLTVLFSCCVLTEICVRWIWPLSFPWITARWVQVALNLFLCFVLFATVLCLEVAYIPYCFVIRGLINPENILYLLKNIFSFRSRVLYMILAVILSIPLSAWVVTVICDLIINEELNLAPSPDVLFVRSSAGWKILNAVWLIVIASIAGAFLTDSFKTRNGRNGALGKGKRLKTRDERGRYSERISERELIKRLDLKRIAYDRAGNAVNPVGGVLVASHPEEMYVLDDYIHSIYVGTTKSGKTESILFPQLQVILDAGENAVITDPKGTLYEEYGWRFKEAGYKVYRINFIEPLRGNFRNPFYSGTVAYQKAMETYERDHAQWLAERKQALKDHVLIADFLRDHPEPVMNNSEAIELWQDVANLLTFQPKAGDNETWNNHARDMIVGGACLLAELGEFDKINIRSIRLLFADPKKLQSVIKEKIAKTNDSFTLLAGFINSPDRTRDSMVSVFNEKTQLLALNKEIRQMTSMTDVDFADLAYEKCVLFFNCHDEKSTYFSLMSLYIDQIYQELVNISRTRLREEGTEKLPRVLNFIFEEFGIMQPLKNIKTMIGACRSRGIRISFFLQDFLQLRDSYGRDIADNLVAQCQHLIYLLSGDENTKKDISAKAGTRLVWNKDSNSYKEVPVMTVDELNDLKIGDFVTIFQRIKGCCKHHFAYFKDARYYRPKPVQEPDPIRNLVDIPVFDIDGFLRT